jgi:hypothetical protein
MLSGLFLSEIEKGQVNGSLVVVCYKYRHDDDMIMVIIIITTTTIIIFRNNLYTC